MATKNIIPRNNNEGKIGTNSKKWAEGHFESLSVAGQSVSGGGATALTGLVDVTITTPQNNQLIQYNSSSSKWVNALLTTDGLSEGSSNLYFTNTRSRSVISVTDSGGDGSLSYNNTSGVLTYTGPSAAEARAHFSSGTGVSISSGEISIGQAVGTSSNVTFNDLVVSGDLTVSGTTTTIDTETINLADNTILLNSNYTGSTPSENCGIEVERGTQVNKTLVWNETTDKWTIGNEIFVAGTFEGNLTGNVTGTVSSIANHDTDGLSEGSNNLYFTNTKARNAISVTDSGGDGSLAYNNSTGVLTYTGPSATEVRAHFSAGTGISISGGGVISSTGGGGSGDIESVTAGNGLSGGGTSGAVTLALDLNELSAADVAVASDSIVIIDANDSNGSKKESIANLIETVAGDGLVASSGVLAVGVDDASIEINSDALRVKASGITDTMLAGSIDDSKLNQITTSDKVAGSSVELSSTSAIENSSGLKIKSSIAGSGLDISSQVISTSPQVITVTVVSSGGNKYALDGVTQKVDSLVKGIKYRFDQSHSTNLNHPFRFSTVSDGNHPSLGSEYTTGVTKVGTPGSSGAYTEIIVPHSAPATLYYYCANHSGMGASVQTEVVAGSGSSTTLQNTVTSTSPLSGATSGTHVWLLNGSTITVTLPSSGITNGTIYQIKNINNTTATVSGTIDNLSSKSLSKHDNLTLVATSTGSQWYIL